MVCPLWLDGNALQNDDQIIRNSPSVSLATSTAHCHLLVALLRDMALGDKSLEFNLSVPLWWSVASSLDIDSGKQSRYTNPIP